MNASEHRPSVFYSGTLITPDGSDTDMYGDGCEPGHGSTMETGWVDPNWSMTTVYDERDHVRPDTWEPADGPLIDWLIDRISDRIGWVDSEGPTGALYAAEAYAEPYTGVTNSLAAHMSGVPAEVQRAVIYGLRFRQAR